MSDDSLAWPLHQLAVATMAVDTAVARRLGLTPTDYQAMKYLLTVDGPVGPAVLARTLGMSTGSATALTDRLEAAGHVRRQAHPADRRRLALTASSTTGEAVETVLRPLADRLDRVAGRFSADDRAVVRAFLAAAVEAYDDFAGTD